MYRIGICDDDKELCSGLEEQIYSIAKELSLKADVEVWYSGEGILKDLQKGMELEQAFRMSDFYIQQLDDVHTVQGVRNLHDAMVLDYTEKMHKICQSDANSKHISLCKEYIYAHIKERITIEDLSEALGVSASYLSRLFKKETGDSVSAYIRRQKIEIAKNLLQYSEYSMIDIANRLSFSSQSHFIQQFREYVGMTPKKYRDLNHSIQWDIVTETKEDKSGNEGVP